MFTHQLKFKFGLWLVILFYPFLLKAEEDFTLEEVRVTGSRIPQDTSQLTRYIAVIGEEEIKNSSAHSVAELLGLGLSTDIQPRSPYGVQSDLAIRGATFEQSLILIDGIRVNDSQTGHHNLDLPLTLKDIERIEVLPGHGSSAYGPDAFGGVVNIITKKPQKNQLYHQLQYAENNTYDVLVSMTRSGEKFGQRLSFNKKRSDGFRADTDFNNLYLFSGSSWQSEKTDFDLSVGYLDKDFGAYDFYTPGRNFPSWEGTRTYFSNLKGRFTLTNIEIAPKIFFRRHEDEFILKRDNPSFYRNQHFTYLGGGELQVAVPLPQGKMVLGLELVEDRINSTNLGQHSLPRQAVFGEFIKTWDRSNLNLGLRTDRSSWGTVFSPTLGVSYLLTDFWKVRTSLGRAFRIPSFTDLYYRDPVNTGNSELKPEKANSYELGLDFTRPEFILSFNLFDRLHLNQIDWVGPTVKGPWKATNIGEVRFYGTELTLGTNWNLFNLKLNYSWIKNSQDEGRDYFSKYAFRYLTNQVSLSVSRSLGWEITPYLGLVYKNRLGENDYFLVNTKISKTIGKISVFVQGTNLLDQQYEEIRGIPQPGRWLGAGVSWYL